MRRRSQLLLPGLFLFLANNTNAKCASSLCRRHQNPVFLPPRTASSPSRYKVRLLHASCLSNLGTLALTAAPSHRLPWHSGLCHDALLYWGIRKQKLEEKGEAQDGSNAEEQWLGGRLTPHGLYAAHGPPVRQTCVKSKWRHLLNCRHFFVLWPLE